MESLHFTIKNAVQFILVLQELCEKERLFLETQANQEYNKYLKIWKVHQKSIVKVPPVNTESPELVKKKANEVVPLSKELEELALVESVLEKARSIRSRNKNFGVATRIIKSPPSCTVPNNATHSPLSHRKTFSTNIEASNKVSRTVPRSKSAMISNGAKGNNNMPRSKSAHTHRTSPAEQGEKRQDSNGCASHSNGCVFKPKMNGSPIDKTAVISKKSFNEYRTMKTSHLFGDKKELPTVKSVVPKSDAHPKPDPQNQFPTLRTFQNELQKKFCSRSYFRLPKCGLWYPFISFKNRCHFLDRMHFTTHDSLRRALRLLHRIQETLLWIDLLSSLGREAFPPSPAAATQKHDWSVIRFFSYLESLNQDNFQRTPILDRD